MKKITILCLLLMFVLCACGTEQTANQIPNENPTTAYIQPETLANTEILESTPTEVYRWKFLSEYELEWLIQMYEAREFDLEDWATRLAEFSSDISKDDIIDMLTKGELTFEVFENNTIQFFETYNECPIILRSCGNPLLALETFPEKFELLLSEANISTEEWAEFEEVFQEFLEKDETALEEYGESKDVAWDAYILAKEAAWQDYLNVKNNLDSLSSEEQIKAKYQYEYDRIRDEFLEDDDYEKYLSSKAQLESDEAEELQKLEEERQQQEEELSKSYELYEQKWNAAYEEYNKKNAAALDLRLLKSDVLFEKVQQHIVYKKIYEISDQETWNDVLTILGFRN